MSKKIIKCEYCGKETTKKRFCSRECMYKARTIKKKKCLNCGKEVSRCEVKYCSRKCYTEHKHKNWLENLEYNKCIICEKETLNQKYCSQQCLGKDKNRHKQAVENLNNSHIWTEEELAKLKTSYGKINLGELADELKVSKTALVRKAEKAGIKSARHWKKEEVDYLEKHLNDDIEKLAKKFNTTKIRVFNKIARMKGFHQGDISVQEKVTRFIRDLGYDLVREVKIDKFKTDIMVKGIDVEVQGSYWHGDKRLYDQDKLDEKQKRRQQDDEKKMKFFTQCGIQIYYIWEYDIILNTDETFEKLAKFLKELPK